MSENETKTDETTTSVAANETALTPEALQSELKRARSEAASYRVAARDAKEAASKEVASQLSSLSDEKASLTAEADRLNLKLHKLEAALSVGIPGESVSEFADRLQGSSLDDLKADAEKLKGMFGTGSTARTAPVDHSQGKGGSTDGSDPADVFAALVTKNLTRRT